MKMNRKDFLKTLGLTGAGIALGGVDVLAQDVPSVPKDRQGEKAKVFFTDDLSIDGLLKIYEKVRHALSGKTAIKLHTGEPHGPNLLPMEFIKALQPKVPNSTIVECNVFYKSPRQTTEGHLATLKTNGWDFCPVDIMDADGDVVLPIPGMKKFLEDGMKLSPDKRPFAEGNHLTEISVGKHFVNYDSFLLYTHFKGHTMAGFGGSLKNIAIGCSSAKVGKRQIHGDDWVRGPIFLERMVEGGKGMLSHYAPKIACINVLKNISVDCDCDPKGAKPTCRDIGIMGSTDVLAIDQASIDMVYAQPEKDRKDIVERIESRSGLRQLEYMKLLGMGNDQYELIRV